ncbi:MAG: hypothetical protein OXH56_08980 [Gemmatimonadetes bacterium]|nr:hypothetical protein [Gemmatimonadota bacterium]
MTSTCSTRHCRKLVKAKGLCRSCYDKHLYRLSKGNGAPLNGHGPVCVDCGKPLHYRADSATRCGACLKSAYLSA